MQVPDPGTQSYFLRLFGRSERTTACACERTGDVTLPQLLHLQNGQSVTGKIFSGQSWLPKALDAEKDDAKLLDQITLRTLSRPATAAERKVVAELIAAGDPRGIVFSDLMWAILNAKDFAFNH